MITMAWANISLTAARHNLGVVKLAAPHSKIMAVIKANGYGHGATCLADALTDADAFAVARIDEAIELRQHGISKDIIILSGANTLADLKACAEYGLQAVLHSPESCESLAQLQQPVQVWLKADTGMHRLGMNPAELSAAMQLLKPYRHLEVVGLLSHLTNSELPDHPDNLQQKADFEAQALTHGFHCRSLANSGGILLNPAIHYEWVRPGIMLYGSNPGQVENELSRKLQPVMTLKSRVIKVKTLQAGERVGYNGIWQANRESTIATIAIGYADGYPRHAANGTPVLINGKTWPLAGRVSMDLITVDVTGGNVKAGDEVTLWGEGLAANLIAGYAQTISYDLFTGVTERVKRIYNQ